MANPAKTRGTSRKLKEVKQDSERKQQSVEIKKKYKKLNRSKRQAASHTAMQSRTRKIKRSREAGRGLQFEDDSSPSANETLSHCLDEMDAFVSTDDNGKEVKAADLGNAGKELVGITVSGSSQSHVRQVSDCFILASNNKSNVSSQCMGSMHTQSTTLPALEDTVKELEMLDNLFGGCTSQQTTAGVSSAIDDHDATPAQADHTEHGSGGDSCCLDNRSRLTPCIRIRFSDLGLQTPSVSMLRDNCLQRNQQGADDGGCVDSTGSGRGSVEGAGNVGNDGVLLRGNIVSTTNNTVQGFISVDQLFGF